MENVKILQIEITNSCNSCDNCYHFCPTQAIFTSTNQYIIDQFSCIFCGICQEVCPVNAIKITNQ